MRIGIVCPYDFGVPGGVQNQVLGIGEALVRRGNVVLIIAPGKRSDAVAFSSLPIEFVGPTIAVPVNGSVARVALSPRSLTRSRKSIAAFKPDLVHLHEPFVPGPSLGALIGSGPPRVGTFHRSGVGRGYQLLGPFVRHELRHLSACVAVSSEAKKTIESVAGRVLNVEIISNGVDIEAFAEVEPMATVGQTMIFVGRHEERKGLRTLLEAMRLIDANIRLWVVGSGPLTSTLKRDSRDIPNVEWLGALDQGELRSYLAAADLFVAPSVSGESFGIVLLEAMAARTAVLASDLPGYRIAAGVAARYVEPQEPRLLAQEINRLMSDPDLRRALVVAGSEQVKGFGFSAIADRYLEVFERVRSEQDHHRPTTTRGGRKIPRAT